MPDDDDTISDTTSTLEEGAVDTSDLDAADAGDVDSEVGGDTNTPADTAKGSTSGDDAADTDATQTGKPAPVEPANPAKAAKIAASTTAHIPDKPTTKTQTTAPTAPPAVDPNKVFNDEKAKWGRERAELLRKQESYERAEHERKLATERQALKPYDPKSADYQRTMPRINKVEAFMAAAETMNEADARALQHRMGITNEDAKLYGDYKRDREERLDTYARDPDAAVDSRLDVRVPEMIQDAFRQFMNHQRAQADVERDMANAEAIRPHAEFIKTRLDAGDTYASVMERVNLLNENAALKAKLGTSSGREATVDRQAKANAERARLTKGSAAVTRDKAVVGKPDFYAEATKWAKDMGIKPGSDKFNRKLVALEQAHRDSANPDQT